MRPALNSLKTIAPPKVHQDHSPTSTALQHQYNAKQSGPPTDDGFTIGHFIGIFLGRFIFHMYQARGERKRKIGFEAKVTAELERLKRMQDAGERQEVQEEYQSGLSIDEVRYIGSSAQTPCSFSRLLRSDMSSADERLT